LNVDSDVPTNTMISNTASVTTASPESDSTNNSSTAQVSVGVSADLSITKIASAASPVNIGDSVTYTLTASNAGTSDVVDAVVTDTLPANLSYSSDDCGASFSAPTLTWNIGALANAASAVCNVVVTVNDVGTITNTASITSSAGDPNPGNNAGSSILGGATLADLSIALSSNAPATPVGLEYIYTVTTTNGGPSDADLLAFNLLVTGPAQLASSDCGVIATGNNLSWTLPSLGVGASSICHITMSVTAAGSINASVSALADTQDPELSNNTAELSVSGISVAPIPTLNQLGLLLLGILLAGLGAMAARRERQGSPVGR
jgi:large repetitive protein